MPRAGRRLRRRTPLIAGGVLRYYVFHAALPRMAEALSNLGFGRDVWLSAGFHPAGYGVLRLIDHGAPPPQT